MNIEDYLTWLNQERKYTREDLLNGFHAAVEQRRNAGQDKSRKGFLKRYGLYELHRTLVTDAGKPSTCSKTFLRNLARLYERTQTPIHFEKSQSPWKNWPEGGLVKVLLGTRSIEYQLAGEGPEEKQPRITQATSQHDLLAVEALINILSNQHNLKYTLQLQPQNATRKNVQQQWRQLLKPHGAQHPSCICVIASPITNVFCDQAAQHILGDSSPVRFRWGVPVEDSFLSESEASGTTQGLYDQAGKQVANRTPWPEVLKRVKTYVKGTKQRASTTPGLEDCGLLLISAKENEPILIVAAGHGSWGTVAAIKALTDTYGILAGDLQSAEGLGKGKTLGVVRVPVCKATNSTKDDLHLPPEWSSDLDAYWNSWQFWRGSKKWSPAM